MSGSPFLPPLNKEYFPTGNSSSQTLVGSPKNFHCLFAIFFNFERKNTLTLKFENLGSTIFGTQIFSKQNKIKKFFGLRANSSQTTFSVRVFFSVPLSEKEFPTRNSLSQTPWGRPKKTLVIIVIVVAPLPSKAT